mmetsp:Transcript_9410/g.21637  ORF Transcript_9410/g.21637 Transcript_9410/m.21637 type:complete len:125 (-) Transcript_9410:630-1004(-)
MLHTQRRASNRPGGVRDPRAGIDQVWRNRDLRGARAVFQRAHTHTDLMAWVCPSHASHVHILALHRILSCALIERRQVDRLAIDDMCKTPCDDLLRVLSLLHQHEAQPRGAQPRDGAAAVAPHV